MSPARSRRRSRSAKLVIAVALLCISATGAAAAVVTATIPALTAATILGVVTGVLAAVLTFAEIRVLRHRWAQDRASLANGYRVEAQERRTVHAAFVQEVTRQIATRDGEIDRQRTELHRLRDRLVDTEIEMALAAERLSEERSRVTALEADAEAAASDLESARADLAKAQDALTISEAAGVAARAEILAWEQATGVSDPHDVGRIRRPA